MSYVHFQLLDCLLGHGHVALFRRAELKTLVDFHGNEVYKLSMAYKLVSIILSHGSWFIN
jgi:hypothetical protein